MREALGRAELRVLYGRLAARYDLQHTLLTAGADQRGRAMLVEACIGEGDTVLDCGAGTGTTGILAARKVGPSGRVTLLDLSEAMLEVAGRKLEREGLEDRVSLQVGDMARLPFESERFDVAISTYSLCPLHDPEGAALELYRVTRPGGRVGVAHSADAEGRVVRRLADWVEGLAWRHPGLSMGCRSVRVRGALERAGARVVLARRIGVPLWPFVVLVVRKPGG